MDPRKCRIIKNCLNDLVLVEAAPRFGRQVVEKFDKIMEMIEANRLVSIQSIA